METTTQAAGQRISDPHLLEYAQHMAQTAESELARHLFAAYVEQTMPRMNARDAGLPRIQLRSNEAQTKRAVRA